MEEKNLKEKIEDIEKEELATPKRKPGRPKKIKPEMETGSEEKNEDGTSQTFDESLKKFSIVLLDLVSPRLPTPQPFSAEEKNLFSNSFGDVIKKHLTSVGKYEEEATLILVTFALLYPRMKTPKKKELEDGL